MKHNIIKSVRGAHGGFEIIKEDIPNIKLSQIVEAIDGDIIYEGCGLGLDKCEEQQPCSVHDKFKIIRKSLKKMLKNTSIEELAIDLQRGTSSL